MKITRSYFVFILFGILITFLYIPKIYQSYHTVSQLEKELKIINIQSEYLTTEVENLNITLEEFDEPYSVEKFVRSHLNMKKKGEMIYRVIYEEELSQ